MIKLPNQLGYAVLLANLLTNLLSAATLVQLAPAKQPLNHCFRYLCRYLLTNLMGELWSLGSQLKLPVPPEALSNIIRFFPVFLASYKSVSARFSIASWLFTAV